MQAANMLLQIYHLLHLLLGLVAILLLWWLLLCLQVLRNTASCSLHTVLGQPQNHLLCHRSKVPRPFLAVTP